MHMKGDIGHDTQSRKERMSVIRSKSKSDKGSKAKAITKALLKMKK